MPLAPRSPRPAPRDFMTYFAPLGLNFFSASIRVCFFMFSSFHTFTLSHFHTFTLSHFHTFPLSHFPTFTLSHFHTFTLSHFLTVVPSGGFVKKNIKKRPLYGRAGAWKGGRKGQLSFFTDHNYKRRLTCLYSI